jgi:hypothetical protein
VFLTFGDSMTRRIFTASRERGMRLMAAGCPLDYPQALPSSSFRAEQVVGYVDSQVYTLGPVQTAYLVCLRLDTDSSSGTVINEWRFEPPWRDHRVEWSHEPVDMIPKRMREACSSLVGPALGRVLHQRRLLRRGYPVEGLLCGRSCQSIPELGGHVAFARLTLIDDRGNTVRLRIALQVIRRAITG